MEIKETNLQAAYNAADESGKQMLRALFPDVEWIENHIDNRPVTERIKTFEDAKNELGLSHPYVCEWTLGENLSPDLEAYLQLRIICAALNEGWEPQFTDDEWHYYPFFWLYTEQEVKDMDEDEKRKRCLLLTGDYQTEYAGFSPAYLNNAPSNARANIGSRLCLKSETLAKYAGEQFADLWMDFYLIHK